MQLHRRTAHRFAALAVLMGTAAPSLAPAQSVLLELRPRVGDTLVLRIEQRTELVGSVLRRGTRDSMVTLRTTMNVSARAIVQRTDARGATLLARTDSVSMTSSDDADLPIIESTERELRGAAVVMRVLPDGSSELLSTETHVSTLLRSLLAEMPAILPTVPVTVGESWTRTVNIPLGTDGISRVPRAVRTTFRLDSLSWNRQLAFISMQGVIVEVLPAAVLRPPTDVQGNVRGRMTVDRRRGWIMDSEADISLSTLVQRPMSESAEPIKFEIRITQRMRTQEMR